MNGSKLFLGLMTVLLLAGIPALISAGEWFDMENCEFCKGLMEDPQLLGNMTWEHHMISNGMMTVTTVKPEFMASYKTAMEKMEIVSKKFHPDR